MIRFMVDASNYGSYHEKLANVIFPYLQAKTHVCDAGCGLGYLSIALSDRIPLITAIDIKPQAVNVLKKNCTERNIRNIRPITGDIHQIPPGKPYDAMIFCFYGRSRDIFEISREQCGGTVVVVKKNYSTHRFSVGKYPSGPDNYNYLLSILNSNGVPHQNREISFEFGQPFRNFEDTRKFFLCYSKDNDPKVLTDEFLRSQVIETGRSDYPIYMPHQRQLGIISFETRDITKIEMDE